MKTGKAPAVSRPRPLLTTVKTPAVPPPQNHLHSLTPFQIAAWTDIPSLGQVQPPAPMVDGNTFAAVRLQVENQSARLSLPANGMTAPVREDRRL